MLSATNLKPDLTTHAVAAASDSNADLTGQKKSRELKPLTSLRFFLASVIVLAHGSESFSCLKGVASHVIFGQAVTFFFVLSGFILAYVYQNISGLKAHIKFFIARFARIWPAHLATLLLLVFLLPEVFKVRSADWPVFLSNLFLVHAWWPQWRVFFSYNATSWSISTEAFFYLFFPLLLFGMNRRWYMPLLLCGSVLVSLLCVCNLLHLPEFDPLKLSNQGLTYIHPLARIFDFALGMTAYLFWKEKLSERAFHILPATLLELSAIVLVVLFNLSSAAMRYACIPVLGDAGAFWMQNSGPSLIGFAFLICVFAMEKGLLSRLFSTRPFVLLGEISFGIYLMHGVILTYLTLNFPQMQSIGAFALFVLVLLFSSHLLFELVENPMRRFFLKQGGKLANLICKDESSSSDGPAKISDRQKRKSLKAGFLAVELIAFACLLYFSLPTIQTVNSKEADMLGRNAPIHNIELGSLYKIRSAEAGINGDKLHMRLVLESLKDQKINSSLRTVVFDRQGNRIASLSCTQDGRRSHVRKGTCFVENLEIADFNTEKASMLAVSILKNKRELLRPLDASLPQRSFELKGECANNDWSFLLPLKNDLHQTHISALTGTN